MRNALHGLQGCSGLKLVLRTVPNLFDYVSTFWWVYENTGSKGRFTNSAAGRSSPGSSKNPSSFKTGFVEIRA